MDVLVDYQGNWGLGDLLCSDPMMLGLVERFGASTRIYVKGKCGNVLHNPLVSGPAEHSQHFDHVVEVKLFTHMDNAEYGKLEAMPSLVAHMCSYAEVTPSDAKPRLHLSQEDLNVLRRIPLLGKPRVAICADFVDPLRHWPLERWQSLAQSLQDAGAQVIEIGTKDRLGIGTDLVGKLTVRETAAVLSACNLFVGNNSGLFHYAQAAGVPCVTLFSLATPARFVHTGASVFPVEATGLPCLHCMTRCFAAMQQSGCTASPRGRCMTDITVESVLSAIDEALQASQLSAPPMLVEPGRHG
ncbi:MAG: ADP-heptose:LPS heptosyltransferase [Planctomycetota bacterium]|jgi:ADP-heptose:LPS heptosyltransferase